MAMGKRRRHAKQASMWVATLDLPRSAADPFYARLNQILDQHDFDGFVEGLCERFYADEGRPGLPPGRYFRLLLIGYFEGLDAERAIAWRAADARTGFHHGLLGGNQGESLKWKENTCQGHPSKSKDLAQTSGMPL
jgi:transposase